jgi:hypothetical protein
MAIVKVGYRLLYDGPSTEDANMIFALCRQYITDYGKIYFSPKPSSIIPRGIIGKVIAKLDKQGDTVRSDMAKMAIREFNRSIPKQAFSQHNTWNNNPSPVPPKAVINNLLANSIADSFENAQTEWDYNGELVFEGDPEFSHECDLCGPKELMKTNYIIRNTRNGNALHVGSVCVKRFLILSGTTSVNESADLFDRKTLLAYYGRKQAYLIADLARDKVPEKTLIAIRSTLDDTFPYGISWEDADIIIREANVTERAGDIFKAVALNDRSIMRQLKIEKMSNRHEGWQKKVTARVVSTLSKSSAYRNY